MPRMNFDWKAIVKTVAPVIGTALGGPLAGTAVKYLADSFLGKPGASEEEVALAMQQLTPEQLISLKQLDADFQKTLIQAGIDFERIAAADRSSARELAKADNRPHIWLSAIYTGGYFGFLFMFFAGKMTLTQDMLGLANGLILVLTTTQATITAFWFGSSSGSKVKDAHLANSQPIGAQ